MNGTQCTAATYRQTQHSEQSRGLTIWVPVDVIVTAWVVDVNLYVCACDLQDNKEP